MNPVPTSPLADDIATAPLGLVAESRLLLVVINFFPVSLVGIFQRQIQICLKGWGCVSKFVKKHYSSNCCYKYLFCYSGTFQGQIQDFLKGWGVGQYS